MVMGRLRRAALLLCALANLGTMCLLSVPASALAKGAGAVAPPGNSGVSQYVEDVPTVKGNRPSSSVVVPIHAGGGGPGSSGGSATSGGPATSGGSPTGATSTLLAAADKQLEHSGPAGKSTAALAHAMAPQATA